MFDLSWVELLFCGALALIVIGPRDMPQLFRAGGRLLSKSRRLYSDVVGSMHQLEREVDMASGKGPEHENWRNLIPEDLRNLPADFRPGSFTAEDHQRRREAIEQARRDAEAARQVDADRQAQLVAAGPGGTDPRTTGNSP